MFLYIDNSYVDNSLMLRVVIPLVLIWLGVEA